MKRIVLALSVLVSGIALLCGFRNSAAQFRSEAASQRDAWLARTQRLAQFQTQRDELTIRIAELKRGLAHLRRSTPEADLMKAIETDGAAHLSPEVRERLLAELGLDWKSSGDYLVVSKDTLREVNFHAVRSNRLRDTVCGVLAITPQERAGIEATMERLAAEFNAWVVSHVQRTEPSSDVLAKYTLPPDPAFSQSLSNTFSAGVHATIGAERGSLLLDYSREWMQDVGMRGDGGSMLTIKRAPAGQEWLPFELKSSDNGTMSAAVSPHQPFPEAFRPIFPGGWTQVAELERFELPKEFHQPKTSGVNP
jgi:hypothetical protein